MPAMVTYAYSHILQDDETLSVPEGFAFEDSFAYDPVAVFALISIHGLSLFRGTSLLLRQINLAALEHIGERVPVELAAWASWYSYRGIITPFAGNALAHLLGEPKFVARKALSLQVHCKAPATLRANAATKRAGASHDFGLWLGLSLNPLDCFLGRLADDWGLVAAGFFESGERTLGRRADLA